MPSPPPSTVFVDNGSIDDSTDNVDPSSASIPSSSSAIDATANLEPTRKTKKTTAAAATEKRKRGAPPQPQGFLRRIKKRGAFKFPEGAMSPEDPLDPKLPPGVAFKWDLEVALPAHGGGGGQSSTLDGSDAQAMSQTRKTRKRKNGVHFKDGDGEQFSDGEVNHDGTGAPVTAFATFFSDTTQDDGGGGGGDNDDDEADADFDLDAMAADMDKNLLSLLAVEEAYAKTIPQPGGVVATVQPPAQKRARKKRKTKTSQEIELPEFKENFYSTLDAASLIAHIESRSAFYAERQKRLSKNEAVLSEIGRPLLSDVSRPFVSLAKLVSSLSIPERIERELISALSACERAIADVEVLKRTHSSVASDSQRLCKLVECLINGTIASHEIRRMPESRNDLIRPVYISTHNSDVLLRIAPPPVHNAAIGETILDETKVVRVVRADMIRREQSITPSHRSNIVTESMVRLHWSPADTSTAHRIARARIASDSIRETNLRRNFASNSLVTAALSLQ